MIQLLFRGGYTMIPIILCSVISLAVIIERGFSLREKKIIPRRLADWLDGSDPEVTGLPEKITDDSGALAGVLRLGCENRELSLEKNYEILQIAEKQIDKQVGTGSWSSWRSWLSSRRSWDSSVQ